MILSCTTGEGNEIFIPSALAGGRLDPASAMGPQRGRLQALSFRSLPASRGRSRPLRRVWVLVVVTGPFDLLSQVFQPFQNSFHCLLKAPKSASSFGSLLRVKLSTACLITASTA